MMAGSSAGGGGRIHGHTPMNPVSNVANQPSVQANNQPAEASRRPPGGRQGHSSSHVAQAAAGALSSDISRRNPQDDYALLQVTYIIGQDYRTRGPILIFCFLVVPIKITIM